MTDNPADRSSVSHAGPFGFTRREIWFLVVIIGLCLGINAWTRWRDAAHNRVPAWVIEDTLIESGDAGTSVATNAPTSPDSARARPRRDHSDLIDINSADTRILARLPGIGPELARRIIAEREANGAFVNIIDLQRVKGIGPKKAAMLSGWIKFAPPAPPDTLQPE